MGFYLICVDGGECILIRASSVEEAGRQARIRRPDAKSLRLKADNRDLIGTESAKNFSHSSSG